MINICLGVFPVRNAGWDLPLLLLLDGDLPGGGVHDGGGWRRRPPRDLLVDFELGRLHGVRLQLHHPDHPLFRP